MNLAEQRRYARDFLRWYMRHQRRSFRLVRSWLDSVRRSVIESLERIGTNATTLSLDTLVPASGIRIVLSQVYRHTLPEAATRERSRILQLLPKPKPELQVEAGFFSALWQNTTARMLSDSDTAQRITQITETTRGQIRRILVQANEENLDVRATAKRIETALGGKGARKRSLMIARTETTRAANAGHEAGALSSNIALKKIWIPTVDSRTRDDHQTMQGKKPIPSSGQFMVGGVKMKYPGDPAGGAKNCVNCRCVVSYVPVNQN